MVLLLITVPVMAPAIFAGFFLSMTFSWDEFVIWFLLIQGPGPSMAPGS